MASDAASAEQRQSDWTQVYRSWEGWTDPEEIARRSREAEERARLRADRAGFMYSRDRSVERRVFERATHEKVAGIQRFRARGNLYFREGQFARAAVQYKAALTWYEYTFPKVLGYSDLTPMSSDKAKQEEASPRRSIEKQQYRTVPMVLRSGLRDPTIITQRDVDRLRLLTLSNLAVCQIRTGQFADAAESCTIAIFEAQRDLLGRSPARDAAEQNKKAAARLEAAIERVDTAFSSVVDGRAAGDEASSRHGSAESSAVRGRGLDGTASVSPAVLALADALREGDPGHDGSVPPDAGPAGADASSGRSTGGDSGVPVVAQRQREAALDALVILLKALLRRAQARRRSRALDLSARDVAAGLLLCGGSAAVEEGAGGRGGPPAVLPELQPAYVAFCRERAWIRRAARAYREKRRRLGRRMGAGALAGGGSVGSLVGGGGDAEGVDGVVPAAAGSVVSGESALSFHPGGGAGAEDADDRRTAGSVMADTALDRDLEDEGGSIFGGVRSVRGGDGDSAGYGEEAASLVGSDEGEATKGVFAIGSARERAGLTTQQLLDAAAARSAAQKRET